MGQWDGISSIVNQPAAENGMTGTIKRDTVLTMTGTATTDDRGVFAPEQITGAKVKAVLGATAEDNWYHFRIYSGSNYNTRVIVTHYNNDTPISNTQVTVTLAYIP